MKKLLGMTSLAAIAAIAFAAPASASTMDHQRALDSLKGSPATQTITIADQAAPTASAVTADERVATGCSIAYGKAAANPGVMFSAAACKAAGGTWHG